MMMNSVILKQENHLKNGYIGNDSFNKKNSKSEALHRLSSGLKIVTRKGYGRYGRLHPANAEIHKASSFKSH